MSRGNSGIKHTCPDIDKVIKRLNSAIKSCEQGIKDGVEYKDSYFKDAISDLDGLESTLEDLRSANDDLRTWGEGQFERAEEFESNLSDAESKVSDLEEKVVALEKELDTITSNLSERGQF